MVGEQSYNLDKQCLCTRSGLLKLGIGWNPPRLTTSDSQKGGWTNVFIESTVIVSRFLILVCFSYTAEYRCHVQRWSVARSWLDRSDYSGGYVPAHPKKVQKEHDMYNKIATHVVVGPVAGKSPFFFNFFMLSGSLFSIYILAALFIPLNTAPRILRQAP